MGRAGLLVASTQCGDSGEEAHAAPAVGLCPRKARWPARDARTRACGRALLLFLTSLLAVRPARLGLVPVPRLNSSAPPAPQVLAFAAQASAWDCAKACRRIFEAYPDITYMVIADVSAYPLGTNHIAAHAAKKLFSKILRVFVPPDLRHRLQINFQAAATCPEFRQPGLQNMTSSPFSIAVRVGQNTWEHWSGPAAEERVLERLTSTLHEAHTMTFAPDHHYFASFPGLQLQHKFKGFLHQGNLVQSL